jgi:hypothetical protein
MTEKGNNESGDSAWSSKQWLRAWSVHRRGCERVEMTGCTSDGRKLLVAVSARTTPGECQSPLDRGRSKVDGHASKLNETGGVNHQRALVAVEAHPTAVESETQQGAERRQEHSS